MLIRQFIVAALAASACAAHADVIPSTGSAGSTAQGGFLSSWTGANGANILSSGVLSGNVSLIGGISYDAASKASASQGTATLADVLYGKASASIGQSADGQTKLYYQQGIDGMYLVGAGHGILAAMLGPGVSVVGSSDGVIISNAKAGGGAAVSSGGGGGPSGGGAGGGGAGAGGGSSGAGAGAGGGGQGGGAGNGGTTGGSPGATVDHLAGGGITVTLPVPAQVPPVADVPPPFGGNPQGDDGGQVAEVPEPSSIALVFAGLLGAGGLARRRKR
ncbi:PEP-CTERM sorting domain-containing protein [Massilia solisilvae]|uniref:PEP-CTERM sorting domain-containing protein n=1 Tax=Massilia solisilvae TaxID=1811225 RepID=A0ABT2BME3_9BURK|nr:PEP-CTERM sorting domain-containing protein [Massilia solisilvae]MCS0609637.1 PEP-CTERM sorting domain-containing protein [Massilia solisilvae]